MLRSSEGPMDEPSSTDHRDGVPILAARDLRLAYGPTPALRGVSIDVVPGEVVVLSGRSGSGKTSLLYCLSGIVRPQSGTVIYGNRRLGEEDDEALSELRLREFGFVFQFGELVPELTLLENVTLPMWLAGERRRVARERATELLERLGIASEADRRPSQVSGGQAQRAAVARSLVHAPRLVFADEPTGSLDSETKRNVLAEFVGLARLMNSAVLMVTHEADAIDFADRHLVMADGRIESMASTPR